ncbi:MAG: (R)-6-hydroxynicotine oxidase, partial [Chloroflexi bacterium]|nr:(R)-6-hydroxynicotine oxidase [Chloroflexota bacterium]
MAIQELGKTQLDAAAVLDLRSRIRGELVQPGDPSYEQVRAVYNGMIDRHPALIVLGVDVADVMSAVNFAREHQLTLAVQGGGHNGAGLGTCDDGVVIDL